jgi:immunity protein, SdpI family
MTSSWRRELPHWALLVALFATAAWGWGRIPERVPVHWGLDGRPDRFGGRVEALLVPSLLALGLYVLLRVLPRFDPGRENYRSFASTYDLIRFLVLAAVAAVTVLTVLATTGRVEMRPDRVATLIGCLLVALGGVLGKVRPNWFVGIRTPWTLSSARSWTRTHRIGGWLFVTGGLATVVAGLAWPAMAFTVLTASVGASAVVSIAYSYWVWRTDPERVPPAGVVPADER